MPALVAVLWLGYILAPAATARAQDPPTAEGCAVTARRFVPVGIVADLAARMPPADPDAAQRYRQALELVRRGCSGAAEQRLHPLRHLRDPSIHALMGWALLAEGLATQAEFVFRETLEILPNDPTAAAGLAALEEPEPEPEADSGLRGLVVTVSTVAGILVGGWLVGQALGPVDGSGAATAGLAVLLGAVAGGAVFFVVSFVATAP